MSTSDLLEEKPPENPPNSAHPPGRNETDSLDRRDFLVRVAGAILAGATLPLAALPAVPAARAGRSLPVLPAKPVEGLHVSPEADEDVLIRMQRDLIRALAKPVDQRRWGMVIDTRKCVGCGACTVGCVFENKLPPGVVYRPVIDTEIGTYPNVTRRFLPRPCMQCDNPPCVPVCPVAATWKREDGVVVIDYDACIGCRYCITACPYQARTFDFGQTWSENAAPGTAASLALDEARTYEAQPSFEYGEAWTRSEGIIPSSPVGNARKCTFCDHRLKEGLLPMCVTTCIGRATLFGDLNDPESIVSELVASSNAVRLKEELGTEPKVYYLL